MSTCVECEVEWKMESNYVNSFNSFHLLSLTIASVQSAEIKEWQKSENSGWQGREKENQVKIKGKNFHFSRHSTNCRGGVWCLSCRQRSRSKNTVLEFSIFGEFEIPFLVWQRRLNCLQFSLSQFTFWKSSMSSSFLPVVALPSLSKENERKNHLWDDNETIVGFQLSHFMFAIFSPMNSARWFSFNYCSSIQMQIAMRSFLITQKHSLVDSVTTQEEVYHLTC